MKKKDILEKTYTYFEYLHIEILSNKINFENLNGPSL